jgi:hypothetical protein
MEATFSSETPVDFQRTTRRYIPEEPLWIGLGWCPSAGFDILNLHFLLAREFDIWCGRKERRWVM